MIQVILRDLRFRFLLVVLAMIGFYFLEPAFHAHDHAHAPVETIPAPDEGPLGIAASLGNLASLAMLILLADFIAGDRRRGYARILYSHPTDPLALYGLRWVIALGVSLLAALLFLLVGQWVAWGHFDGGWVGMWMALVAAIAFGGFTAGVSALARRGDAWIVVGVYAVTLLWLQILALGAEPFTPLLRQIVTFVLLPLPALQEMFTGIVTGEMAWGAAAFAAGYGIVWLIIAALAVRLREVP